MSGGRTLTKVLTRTMLFLHCLCCVSLFLSSCAERVTYSTNAAHKLSFSLDTVSFDTVFTSIGSSVEGFIVYNNNDEALRLDVSVAGGADSPFRINVDGQSGVSLGGLEIRGGDSLFCFVSVTIDPHDSDSPLLEEDSIRFLLESGTHQSVLLQAYGQDIVRMNGTVLKAGTHTVLTSARPYLIYDSLYVEKGAVLELRRGARLCFHDKAWMRVSGRLLADGSPDSMVVMRGDRMDNMLTDIPYDIVAGRWGGITFDSCSFGNRLSGCDIHGGEWGVKADTSAVDSLKVLMDGCIVHNVRGNALELDFCRAEVRNSQISNAGVHCVSLLGGYSTFNFCTIASFYPWSLRECALFISNRSDSVSYPLARADFLNCIITGISDDELLLSLADSTDNYSITHSLVLTKDTVNPHLRDNVWDVESNKVYGAGNFLHVAEGDFKYDFRLDSLSLARGMAAPSALCPYDITGLARPDSLADVGCFQYTSQ